MRRNIVYKVVMVKDYKFMSTNTVFLESGYSIPPYANLEYGVNKTTVPKVGKLFVFKDFSSAEAWSSPRQTIIKGYATNLTPARERLSISYIKNGNIEIFWDERSDKRGLALNPVPDNTIFCDSFTGLKVF